MSNFTTFSEFWPFYVREHSKALTRRMHFVGTACLFPLLYLAVFVDSLWFASMPIVAYGFAWAAHFLVEKNKPATFQHPLWSLLADFKMFGLMCVGKMDAEVEKACSTSAN